MKNQQVAILVIVGGIVGILSGSLLALLVAPLLDQSQWLTALVKLAFLLVAVAFVFGPMIKGYVAASGCLVEDIQIMITANPAHRASIEETPGNLKPMAQAINSLGQQYQQAVENQAARIEQAQARVADEKNKLAILIEDLSEGIVVCNMQGRILLYNNRATQLLGRQAVKNLDNATLGFVGLGRSINRPYPGDGAAGGALPSL